MKLIVTGAAGMLGHDVLRAFPEDEVLPVDITGDCMPVDITDLEGVRRCVRGAKPDAVVHLAAFTNVDGCETDPETAWRVNAGGTWNLAAACQEAHCAMVYISTDFVFDGAGSRPYDEFDQPNPISVYGRTKFAGEQFVRQLVRKHYIVRTAWLYGVYGKSFPRTMITLASQGKPLKVVGDQIGSPTFTRDLAAAISRMVRKPLYGTYHVTNSGECSWFDLARAALDLYGLNEAELSKINSEEWPAPAKRPAYSVLEHRALRLSGEPEMRPWREALEDFIRDYRAEEARA